MLIQSFIYIKPIKFLEKRPSKIKYNTNNAIHKRYFSLNWHNNYKKEVAKKAINKNDNKKTLK